VPIVGAGAVVAGINIGPALGAAAAVTGAVTGAATGVAGAVTGVAGNVVGGVVGTVAGAGLSSVFDAASSWVASGAVWLLAQVGRALSATTTVDLSSGWFSAHQSVMVTLAAALVLPMMCCAVIQALYRQSASMLARTFLVQLPLALLLTGVAVEIVQMALAITDSLSAQLLSSAGVDTTNLLSPVSGALVGPGLVAPAVPAFVLFIGGLLVAVMSLALWLELVVRAAAVTVATLFLPLALAALVWPAVSHWCRRLADTLAALILSKLVIAAVLSLAVGALAGGLGVGSSGNGGGFAAVISGIALLVVATFAPFTLLRLIPAIESGAISHLDGSRHRATVQMTRAHQGIKNLKADKAEAAKGAGGAGAAGLAGLAGAAAAAAGRVVPDMKQFPGNLASEQQAKWDKVKAAAEAGGTGGASSGGTSLRPDVAGHEVGRGRGAGGQDATDARG
jgi:hypothetical protein